MGRNRAGNGFRNHTMMINDDRRYLYMVGKLGKQDLS